jgi:hypothetical protein
VPLLLPLCLRAAHANGVSLNPAFETFPAQESGVKEERIPEAWRLEYLKRAKGKLAEDVTRLFDREWQLERSNDRLTQRLGEMAKSLRQVKIWLLVIVIPLLALMAEALWEKFGH